MILWPFICKSSSLEIIHNDMSMLQFVLMKPEKNSIAIIGISLYFMAMAASLVTWQKKLQNSYAKIFCGNKPMVDVLNSLTSSIKLMISLFRYVTVFLIKTISGFQWTLSEELLILPLTPYLIYRCTRLRDILQEEMSQVSTLYTNWP